MQTILGGNGTIGTLLAKELRQYTQKIRLVSRNPVKINTEDELFPADLLDPEKVDKAIEGSEVVYLLVGFEYKTKVWKESWPLLMHSVITSCKKHKAKLVFFDNMYLYDANELPHMTENSRINPPSVKGEIRKIVYDMMMDEVKSGNLTALVARSADFYGPGNETSFVIQVIYKNLLKGKNPNWFLDVNNKHSLTYTPDAAKATAILGNTPDAFNQVWHLPTDKNTLTGKQLIQLFMDEMKLKKNITVFGRFIISLLGVFIPVLKEMKEMLYQYDRDYIFDSSKFEKRFNFTPTTYLQGVKNIVNEK